MSYRQTKRYRRQAAQGWAMLIAAASLFVATIASAYHIDAAQGVSVSASLAAWGL